MGRHGKELRAILPVSVDDRNHAKVGFVHQSRGLQSVSGTLSSQISRGELDQLGMHETDGFVAGIAIAFSPAAE